MLYDQIPDEAQAVAREVVRELESQGFKSQFDRAISEHAPYRTSVLFSQKQFNLLVEAQGKPDYSRTLQDLARWLASEHEYCEFYVAVSGDVDVNARQLSDMRRDGVGLMIVSDTLVEFASKARNYALQVRPEPTLKFGPHAKVVTSSIRKFNNGEPKDGLRDVCELVEGLVDKIARRLAKKNVLKKSEAEISRLRWANQVDNLFSWKQYRTGIPSALTIELKADLDSFRGARNLVDHKVRSKTEDIRRQRQYPDRMLAGVRLVSELQSLYRKV